MQRQPAGNRTSSARLHIPGTAETRGPRNVVVLFLRIAER